jgi:hypothetical protein
MTRYGWLFWIPLLVAAGIIGYEYLLIRRNKMFKRKKKDNSAKIAHTKFIRNLPEYKKARKRYNLLLGFAAALYVVAAGALTFLSSRPISVTESKEEKENRDIMLCLDVSGSMDAYIDEISDAFIDLIKKMDGERFGITIFDGEYAMLSPLSDDYSSILELLTDFKNRTLFKNYANGLQATYSMAGSSQIGAGLIGCVDGFDRLEETERSRSVILATDNYGPNKPIATLEQAAYYARERDVTVYGLNISDYADQDEIDDGTATRTKSEMEFQNAAILTGGSYFAMNSINGTSPKKIISQIMAQEAARYEGAGQLVRNDVPEIAAIISATTLVVLVIIIWRLYL